LGDKVNPSNAELNPICHLLALVGAHHILHVSRIRVKENGGGGRAGSSHVRTKLVLGFDSISEE
jgi:hypothetical protein